MPRETYQIVTAVCVFHHIGPAEWVKSALQIYESLVNRGIFLLFEHNPLNPVTRWMVSRTQVDRNAHLLTPLVSKDLLRGVGFTNVRLEYFLFFPAATQISRPG